MQRKRDESVGTPPETTRTVRAAAKPTVHSAHTARAMKPAPAAEPLLELEWSFGYLFKQAHSTFTRPLASRLKPHGITLAQWYFLRQLWQEEGITQRELSRRMDVSEPTTTAALDLMEKAGLIERQRNPLLRNKVSLRLTQKGRLLREDVVHIPLDVNVDATRGIAKADLALVRSIVLRMMDNINRTLPANSAKAGGV